MENRLVTKGMRIGERTVDLESGSFSGYLYTDLGMMFHVLLYFL